MLLDAIGATHRLLTAMGPSGDFLCTVSSPVLAFAALQSGLWTESYDSCGPLVCTGDPVA